MSTNIISNFVFSYPDVAGLIFGHVKDRGAISRADKRLYEVVHNNERRREFPRLLTLLERIFKQENLLSQKQKTALGKIWALVDDTVDSLMDGRRTVKICPVSWVKRRIAAALSRDPESVQQLLMSNDHELACELVCELGDAAKAYSRLSAFLKGAPSFLEVRKVVECFKSLPRQYLKRAFDLIEAQQGAWPLHALLFLSDMYAVLHELGDDTIAPLAYKKTFTILNECTCMMDLRKSEPNTMASITVLLFRMLLREKKSGSVIGLLERLYPDPSSIRKVCQALDEFVATKGGDDGAELFAESEGVLPALLFILEPD